MLRLARGQVRRPFFSSFLCVYETRRPGGTNRPPHHHQTPQQHYQLACAKHFEVSHKGAESLISLDGVGNHPNAWFAASMAYYKELNKDRAPPQSSSSSSSGSQEVGNSGASQELTGTGSEGAGAAMEVDPVN